MLAGFDPVIASDIYMLGNIMFYLCSGGKTVRPLREAEYVLNLEQVNPSAPTELKQLIQNMTQFDSNNRIQPLSKVIEKIEFFLLASPNDTIQPSSSNAVVSSTSSIAAIPTKNLKSKFGSLFGDVKEKLGPT